MKEHLIKVAVGKEVNIDTALFGNDLMYNEIVISLKNEIERIDMQPKIAKITNLGVVIATDSTEQGTPPNFGFHNYFIPWTEINYIHQYIAT